MESSKKYWWIASVVVPVATAIIALVPDLLPEKQQDTFVVDDTMDESVSVVTSSKGTFPAKVRVVVDVSMDQYLNELKAIEKRLNEKYNTINQKLSDADPNNKTKLNKDKQLTEREIEDLRTKTVSLEQSYDAQKQQLQAQIDALGEYSELIDADKDPASAKDLQDAQLALAKGDQNKAKIMFSRITTLPNASKQQIANAKYNLGLIAESRLDYRSAYQHYGEAVNLDGENIRYLNKAGDMAKTMAQYDVATAYYEDILHKVNNSEAEASITPASVKSNLGTVWRKKGRYNKAISYFEDSLAENLLKHGPEHSAVTSEWNNLGIAWRNKKKYDKAIDYFEKALNADKKINNGSHPDVARDLLNLGVVWADKKDYDNAIKYYEEALKINKQYFKQGHPKIAKCLNNLGIAWRNKGEPVKAIEYYEQAVDINIEVYGQSHPAVAAGWNNLGLAYTDQRNYSKAKIYFSKALTVQEKYLGELHPHTVAARENLKRAESAEVFVFGGD